MEYLLFSIGIGLIAIFAYIIFRTATLAHRQIPSISTPREILDAQALAGRLGKAIQFKTISYSDPSQFNGIEFKRFIEFLEQSFPKLHATLKREIVAEFSLLFTWEGSNDKEMPILLAAHIDVVPAQTDSGPQWTYPPFKGHLADGFIWGRGTIDDKACLMGILEAVEKLLQEGFVPRRTFYLALGHDEEVGGFEGASKISALLKSRGVEFEYVLDEGLTITEGIVPNIAKPVALVGIAEKGSVYLEFTVDSVGGHSSMPPKQTAVGILGSAISKIEQNPFPPRFELPVREMFQTLSAEMPFIMRVVFANLWLFKGLVMKRLTADPRSNAMLRTTAAPTIFNAGIRENILATGARAIVNYRTLPGDPVNEVISNTQAIINDPRITIKLLRDFKMDSLVSDTASRGYHVLEDVIRQIFPDVVVAPSLVVPATDSRHYSTLTRNIFRFLPIRLGSEDTKRVHGIDERVTMEGYAQAVQFYLQLLRKEGSEIKD